MESYILFLFIFCFNLIALRLFGFLVSKRILATSMNLVVLFLLLKEKDLAIFLLFDIFADSATFFLFNIYERRDIFFFLGFNIFGLIIYFFVDLPFIEHIPRTKMEERFLTITFSFLSLSTYCFGLYTFLKINGKYQKALSKRFYKSKSLNHKLLSIIRENELLYDTLNHDIKNSLTGIAGLKDILNRLLVRKNINEPDLNRYLMALFSANNRALSIVNEFTSLSEVNITNLLDNFQGKISSKNIQLSMNCPKQIRLKTNRVSLNRILENLISNAIKFTPSGKKIHIEVEVYIDKPLSICITDEGIGIPDKILKHIFELSSIKKRQGLENEISTGLGLFICKMISRKLGGYINVESREDSGSKFTLSLPLDIVVNE